MGKRKSVHKNDYHYLAGQKVLLKTPSGFALFLVEKIALEEDKNIWMYFANSREAQQVLFTIGFVKVDPNSAWDDGDAGPGKDLIQLIRRHCRSGEELFVQDAEIKASIEKKHDVMCICDGHTVDELMWGIKNVVHDFVREEKDNITADYRLPLSKELLKCLEYYLIIISKEMLDQCFISTFGYLCYMDMNLEKVAKMLRKSYDKYVRIGGSIQDDLTYAKVLAMALVPEWCDEEHDFSKTFSADLTSKLEQATKFASKLGVEFNMHDIRTIMGSFDYLLNAPDLRDEILMRVKLMEASRYKSKFSRMIYEARVANGYEASIKMVDDAHAGDHVHFEPLDFRMTLVETPSGFAIFNIHDNLFKNPEHVWTCLVDPCDARNVVLALGFVKVDDKSVAWNNIINPSEKLRRLILRFCKDKELFVQNTELKLLIQSKLGIKCLTDEEVTGELVWGLKYLLNQYIREEANKVTDEYYFPLSKGLQKDLETYGLNIPPRKIDKEFFYTFSHLFNLDVKSKTTAKALRDKFDHYVSGIGESITDDSLYAAAIAKILVPEAEHEFDFSKLAGDFPSVIMRAHAEGAGKAISSDDKQAILKSRDYLLDICEQKRETLECLRLWKWEKSSSTEDQADVNETAAVCDGGGEVQSMVDSSIEIGYNGVDKEEGGCPANMKAAS